ncbi:carbon-nitrogen family hydrolase [Fusobacterium animalis]|uniref:carbon-nitrogen family hydrolase n=1 Tax=Fusobacterium animalis TaxID=76859 RepID=UPI0034DDF90C
MKISIVQMAVKYKNIEENYLKFKKLIDKTKGDVIVFPETWTTGFFPKENLQKYADINGKRLKEFVSKICKEKNTNIVAGSIINKIKDNEIFNTSLIFNREGKNIASYSKTHLFSPMYEDKYFKKGNEIVTFLIDGVLCGIIICYDIRFLELTRILSLKGIEILFVVAQWPIERIEHWKLLNRVRAIENQIFVVGVNACGMAENIKFGGNSIIIDPWGKILCQLGENEDVLTVDLNLDELKEIREKINIYRDRRPELYKNDWQEVKNEN